MKKPRLQKEKLYSVQCAGCAACCCEPVVPLTHHDLRRLVKATGRRPADLVKMYDKSEVDYSRGDNDWFKLRGGKRMLGLRKPKGRCIFLSPDDHCTVYDARPVTCRLYPLLLAFVDDDEVDSFEVAGFNSAGIPSCGACPQPTTDPQQTRELYRRAKRERRAYWQQLAKWRKSKKPGRKKQFLRFLGFSTKKQGQRI